MTVREVVSQVRSMSKLLSSDALISDRVIYNECKDTANKLVKQSLDKRKLWQSPNLFAYLPCLEMEEVPITECCEFTGNCNVAKSKKELPTIGEGIWGLAIQGVFGLDKSVKIKASNPNRYSNLLKLNLPVKSTYFWIQNNHLYVSNPSTRAVDMYAYFLDDIPNDLLYPGSGCNCKHGPDIESLCTPTLDKKFYFPGDKVDDLKDIVYAKLLKVYFNLPIDKTSNQEDETSK